MGAGWSPEDYERRRRVMVRYLTMLVDAVMADEHRKHPKGHFTRADAVREVRRIQRDVFRRFKPASGTRTSRLYRRLVGVILNELERRAVH